MHFFLSFSLSQEALTGSCPPGRELALGGGIDEGEGLGGTLSTIQEIMEGIALQKGR